MLVSVLGRCLCKSQYSHYSSLSRVKFFRDHDMILNLIRSSRNISFFKLQNVRKSKYITIGPKYRDIGLLHHNTIGNRRNEFEVLHVRTNSSIQNTTSKTEEKSPVKKSSWIRGENAWKLGLTMLGLSGLVIGGNLLFMWGAPSLDQDGNEVVDEFSVLPKWKAYPLRTIKEFQFFKKMIQEPSSLKLLPDPLKEPYYQPKYTLVLEMTGVLVHPDWTLNTGWRFKKRPAVEYFLQQICPPLFEVVIYTKEQGFTAYPIINGLDPNGLISFRLFRDATRYIDGHHVKDLDCLNRDLSKVIVIDCDPNAVKLHPRNALQLGKWKGEEGDRKLVELAAFLRTIASSNVEDVRPVLEHYGQFNDPLEAFKENQIKLQEQEQIRMSSKPEKKSLVGGFTLGLKGRRS